MFREIRLAQCLATAAGVLLEPIWRPHLVNTASNWSFRARSRPHLGRRCAKPAWDWRNLARVWPTGGGSDRNFPVVCQIRPAFKELRAVSAKQLPILASSSSRVVRTRPDAGQAWPGVERSWGRFGGPCSSPTLGPRLRCEARAWLSPTWEVSPGAPDVSAVICRSTSVAPRRRAQSARGPTSVCRRFGPHAMSIVAARAALRPPGVAGGGDADGHGRGRPRRCSSRGRCGPWGGCAGAGRRRGGGLAPPATSAAGAPDGAHASPRKGRRLRRSQQRGREGRAERAPHTWHATSVEIAPWQNPRSKS